MFIESEFAGYPTIFNCSTTGSNATAISICGCFFLEELMVPDRVTFARGLAGGPGHGHGGGAGTYS